VSTELGSYRGKTILVTGSAGVVGSAIVRQLSACACRLVCQYHDKVPPQPRADAEIVAVRQDLRDDGFWEALLPGVDLVFHLAAQTSARQANRHPVDDVQHNVIPLARFLEAAHAHGWRPGIVLAGTATQVGITHRYPVDESLRDEPVTLYDVHKLTAEHYLRYYTDRMGGAGVTLRLANVYGPSPESSQQDRGVTNMMVRQALQGRALSVYDGGARMRDYIYIDDVAAAFVRAGAHLPVVKGRYFVIGSGTGHTICQMAEMVRDAVAAATGRRVEIIDVPAPADLPPIEQRDFVADVRAFSAAAGWRAQWTLADGLRATVRYYQSST